MLSHPAQHLHTSVCAAVRTMNESDMDIESADSDSELLTSSDSSDDDLNDQEAASGAEFVHARLFTLISDYMGMIDTRPRRARRRWQVRPGCSQDTLETWPDLDAVEEDKNYREEFRVDKQTFDMLHQEIKVSLAVVHGAGALSYKRIVAACVLCRTSLP